jgi:TonB-linked SusC/RagA family outer membrane protein
MEGRYQKSFTDLYRFILYKEFFKKGVFQNTKTIILGYLIMDDKRLSHCGYIRMLTRISLLFLALIVCGTAVYAQNNQVSGTVTDATSGQPLAGVNILVKGTSQGTVTHKDGSYQLNVPSLSDTLRFTFIGYATKNIPINGKTHIDVQLSSTIVTGKQMVVIGYGTKQQNEVTGAISSVSTQDLQEQPTASPVKALQGQAAGVTVVSSGQPGQSPNIRIRGSNTFGDNAPLYVVDGTPTRDISSLNPNEIASMSVLKGAAAASIYGSRASNGVIVVTTKTGQKGKVQVHYSAYGGFSMPPHGNVWNLADAKEQMKIMWNATLNAGKTPSSLPQFYNPTDTTKPYYPLYIQPTGIRDADDPAVDPDKYFVDPNYTSKDELSSFYYITKASQQGTNWFQELFSPGAIMNQNVAVSGGSDIGNYLFAVNYFHNAGNIPNQFLKRYSIRANTNFQVGDNIQIGENLAYHITDNPRVAVHTEGGPLGMAMRENPIIPVFDIGGNYAGTAAEGFGNAYNPLFLAYNNRRSKAQTNKLFGNVFAQVDLWKHRVTIKTTFGGDYTNDFGHSFNFPSYARSENTTTNQFNRNSDVSFDYTWTTTADYDQSFKGGHNVELLVGMEAQKNKYSGQAGSIQGFFSFDPAFVNLSNGSGTRNVSSYHGETSIFSLFGRLDYNYKQRYLISATLRRDGSSKFLNDRYGLFPAGSIGWRISNEPFFHVSWINNLKLRAGYGIMGNQLNVNANNPYTLFGNDQASAYYAIGGSNGTSTLGFRQSTIGNPAAHWEKDKNLDIGIDATLFNGGLTVKASYYQKKIKGLLYNPSLPGTAGGAAQPFVNVGAMSNKGIDITLGTLDHITHNLQFNANVTFTSYHNKIEKISQLANYFDEAKRRFNGQSIVRNQVGHPISSFYGFKVLGYWNDQDTIDKLNEKVQQSTGDPDDVYEKQARPGTFRYADTNGDGRITLADRTFIGDPNPDFTYGINIGLKFKNIDFRMFWYGTHGNDIWNQVKYYHDFMSDFAGSKSKIVLYDSWTPQNHNAAVPINTTEKLFSTSQVPNSFFVENGSYLRLKNIVVGYTLPETILQGIGIQKLRFYVKAANLLTITPYSGIDPAVGYWTQNSPDPENGGTSTAFGIDSGTYPTMHKYLIGIDLKF